MPDRDLRTLTDAGVFADIDRYFGESMIDLGATPQIALSAGMVSAMYRAGHTCLPLANAGKAIADVLPPPTRADEMPEPAANVRLPDYDRHAGGAHYLFLRGMRTDAPGHGVHFDRPARECVVAISRCLSGDDDA